MKNKYRFQCGSSIICTYAEDETKARKEVEDALVYSEYTRRFARREAAKATVLKVTPNVTHDTDTEND